MIQKLTNKKGFTLIELMIVIAIIGVLAAIAIPNFISYRNKSFCAKSERMAGDVMSALSSYYKDANHRSLETSTSNLDGLPDLPDGMSVTISGTIDAITVVTTRVDPCPTDTGTGFLKSMPGSADDGWQS